MSEPSQAPVPEEAPGDAGTGPSPRLRAAAAVLAVALVAASALVFDDRRYAALAAFFCVVLVAVTVTDIERRVIPNRIVVPATVIALVAHTAIDPSVEWLLGALGAGGFLLLAALVNPAGMGMGDVKLAALIGAVLGRATMSALFAAFLLALVPSLYLLARHGRAGRKMGFAFGPFLALGAALVLFAGAL